MVAEGALFTHNVMCFLGRAAFKEGTTISADNMRNADQLVVFLWHSRANCLVKSK